MSRDEMLDTTMLKTVEEMLSREYYDEMVSFNEEYPALLEGLGLSTYEEYRETIFSMLGDYEETLKIIGIYSYSVDTALADTLKKMLPDCDIAVEADQFFNNNT